MDSWRRGKEHCRVQFKPFERRITMKWVPKAFIVSSWQIQSTVNGVVQFPMELIDEMLILNAMRFVSIFSSRVGHVSAKPLFDNLISSMLND
jgi:hypothetical protein